MPDEIAALTDKRLAVCRRGEFQNMKAEAVGRTIVLQGSAKASGQAAYKELQQRIIDRVMSDHAAIARGHPRRAELQDQVYNAKNVDDLAQGIKRIEDESNRLQKSDEEARARSTALREELSPKGRSKRPLRKPAGKAPPTRQPTD